ncbi:MAG: D-serine ammonia-lyase, partial [Clostridia bacterium]|nr:D-serine ammonia-lyase [Clostridia bacterium]
MVIEKLKNSEELLWINEKLTEYKDADLHCDLTNKDVEDAEQRLKRFAPFIMKAFPETNESQGIIESELKEINLMKEALSENIKGRMLLKMDANLPIAGSVKARGGIYEVLKHTEELALANGLITLESDYSELLNHKDFFKDYSVQV